MNWSLLARAWQTLCTLLEEPICSCPQGNTTSNILQCLTAVFSYPLANVYFTELFRRRRISCKTIFDSELPGERGEWLLFGYWYVQPEIEGSQCKAIKQHIWQANTTWKCLCFSFCTGTPRHIGGLLCRRWLNSSLQGEAEGWSIWCDTVGLNVLCMFNGWD